jgi:uncharacterized protein YodC (DUF2158 family)
MSIQNGTIVWLKSGSPSMTVKWKTINGDWLCAWFDKTTIKEHTFSLEQLTEENPYPAVDVPFYAG